MTQATLATTGLLNNVPDKLPDEAADQTASVNLAVGKIERDLAAHETPYLADRHRARRGRRRRGDRRPRAVRHAGLADLRRE